MTEKKITEASVLSLVREHKVTISRGAELLGIPIQDFLELMSKNRISVMDYEPGTLEQNLKVLRKAFEKAKVSK